MTWLLSELNSDWEFLFSVQFHLPAFVSLPRSVSLHSADTATAAAGSSPKAVDALLASPALLSYSKTTTERTQKQKGVNTLIARIKNQSIGYYCSKYSKEDELTWLSQQACGLGQQFPMCTSTPAGMEAAPPASRGQCWSLPSNHTDIDTPARVTCPFDARFPMLLSALLY